MKDQKGFTLIEIVVAISIIAILTIAALTGVGAAQKQGRDSVRRSHLDVYRGALESYAGMNNSLYPNAAGNLSTMAGASLAGFVSSVLYDPKNGNTVGTCPPTTTTYAFCYYVNVTTSADYVIVDSLESGGFWVACSGGKVGKLAAAPASWIPTAAAPCPLP